MLRDFRLPGEPIDVDVVAEEMREQMSVMHRELALPPMKTFLRENYIFVHITERRH